MIKQFKLSVQEKEKLIKLKAKTGINNWNILCRWAFCYSLSEPSIPSGPDILSDSNVEMTWLVFGGEYHEIYEALLRKRCKDDNLDYNDKTLYRYFRLHLNRGINYLAGPNIVKSCEDLFNLTKKVQSEA